MFLKMVKGKSQYLILSYQFPRLYQSVNLIFAFAMFMTVGVQFYVLINIVWPAIEQRLPSDLSAFHKKCAEFITRTSLLCFICKYCLMLY